MFAGQPAAEGAAITALGSLFKLTEVFLWDDAVVDFSEASGWREASAEQPTSCCTTADASLSLNQSVRVSDYNSVEDMDLAREMDALGLPISFSTSKEKNGAKTQKKKATRLKSVSDVEDMKNRTFEISDTIEREDVTSHNVFHDSTNMLSSCRSGETPNAASYCLLQEEQNKDDVHSDAESGSLFNAFLSETGMDRDDDTVINFTSANAETIPGEIDLVGNAQILENTSRLDAESCTVNTGDGSPGIGQEVKSFDEHKEKCSEVSSISCHITCVKNDGGDVTTLEPVLSSQSDTLMKNTTRKCLDNSTSCELGVWRVLWDAFYSRNYFYNCQTQESTWYPPQGLEHFAFAFSTDEAGDNAGSEVACDAVPNEGAHTSLNKAHFCTENGNSMQCTRQSSEEISSSMDDATCITTSAVNILAGDVPAEHLCEHAEVNKISEEQASSLLSDVKMCAIGEPGAYVTQTESVSCCEAPSLLYTSLDVQIYDSGLPEKYMTPLVDELDGDHDIGTSKKKKRPRRPQSYKNVCSALGSEPMLEGVSRGAFKNILKYWCQRYLLFSRYDDGIKMDEEGWFSVTPESIARHHASRCGSGTVIDCFTGVGGNAIQFAKRSNHVIAIDIDPQKIDYARHNAAIYGVDDRIDFIQGDFFQMASCMKGNIVFMSPPWGGPDYLKAETFDIISMLKPHDGDSLFKIGRSIALRVILFLPRNVDINQLAELSLSVDPPWTLEVEKNFLNGRLKAVTAYFSSQTM